MGEMPGKKRKGLTLPARSKQGPVGQYGVEQDDRTAGQAHVLAISSPQHKHSKSQALWAMKSQQERRTGEGG